MPPPQMPRQEVTEAPLVSNPHPHSKCPLCGCSKPVISWSACSRFCADYMQSIPKQQWKLPDAFVGSEEPQTLWTGDR